MGRANVTVFDVSAQFGGREAARAGLPHFHALKAAARGLTFSGLPLPVLAFMLRIDGEVSVYGPLGPSNVAFDDSGHFVSVDIGVSQAQQAHLAPPVLAAQIAEAICSSVGLLRDALGRRGEAVDWPSLERAVKGFAEAYRALMESSSATDP